MKRVGLTGQQRKLFDFIAGELGAERPSPSYEEMRAFMGLRSKSGIARLVDGLLERGHLVALVGRARSLALPGPQEIVPVVALDAPPLGVPQRLANDVVAYAQRKGLSPRTVAAAALDDFMRRNP